MPKDPGAGQGGLFDVPELAALPNAGRVEAGLHRALVEAEELALVRPEDAGLIGAALEAARAIDAAATIRDPKDRAYAVTALLPPYQRALHGLRIPAEVAAVGTPRTPEPAPGGGGAPEWLRDEFGPGGGS